MTTHALRRTSPKGQPFIGVCTKCGEENLTMKAISEYCQNIRGVSEKDALIESLGFKKG